MLFGQTKNFKNGFWSDETKTELFGRNVTAFMSKSSFFVLNIRNEYLPKHTIPKVKFRGGSIMIWSFFSTLIVVNIEI